MQKIIIAGSKSFQNENLFAQTLLDYMEKSGPIDCIFIHGTQTPIQRYAIFFALKHQIKIRLYTANPQSTNLSKNVINDTMSKHATACIYFHYHQNMPVNSLLTTCKQYNKKIFYKRFSRE